MFPGADKLVSGIARGLFKLLAEGAVAGLGAILKWFNQSATPDFTKPWAHELLGRAWVAAVLVALAAATLMVIIRGVQRGPAGVAATLGNVILGWVYAGFIIAVLAMLLSAADALTAMLAPNFDRDAQQIMATLTTWASASGTINGILLWLVLAFIAVLAVAVIAVQLYVRKFFLVLLWTLSPLAGALGPVDPGILVRHGTLLMAVVLSKPLLAGSFAALAGMLRGATTGQAGANLDVALAATVGLGAAAFAPFLILRGLIGWLHQAAAGASRTAAPTSTTAAVVSATSPRTIAQRVWSSRQQQVHTQTVNRAAWGAPATRLAGAAGAATVGATVVSSTAKMGGQAVIRTAKAPLPTVPATRLAPTIPRGLSGAERQAWLRQHVQQAADAKRPTQPAPPS
jgi:hypothetical protein